MASSEIVEQFLHTRENLRQTKRERAMAMDAIIDLTIERAEMRRLLAEFVEVLEGLPVGSALPVDAIAVHIKAKDYLRRV